MKTEPSDITRKPSITSGQAARMVGVSTDCLENLARKGVLEPERTPTGRYLYRPTDVDKAIAHFAQRRRA